MQAFGCGSLGVTSRIKRVCVGNCVFVCEFPDLDVDG
jgi:hypothetical protein